MNNTTNCYCLILAGGKGRRLWPCSRSEYPKQFIDFFGTGRTLLQQTFDRMAHLLPADHIFISTNSSFLHLVREQLPEVSRSHILAEPIHRNTAPAMAWGNHRIETLNPDASLIMVPSDQIIFHEDTFREDVMDGFRFVAQHDMLLTLGIKPTRPEPGYGYIQLDEQLEADVYKARTFTEKPDREFAKMFVSSGEFYWNTGIFLSSCRYLRQRLSVLLPDVLRTLDKMQPNATPAQEDAYMAENFTRYPNLSLEGCLLQDANSVAIMRCHFGWAEIGSWHSIYEALPKNNDNNVVINSEVMMDNSRNNVIKLEKGRLAVINGLEGFIVVEKDNVLLICRKEDSSALVRKYVSEVQLKKGDEYV